MAVAASPKPMVRKVTISAQSMIVVSADQVSADLADEVAILNMTSGVYYGLDEVGGLVWRLIQRPTAVAEVRDTLVAEYDVEPDECERDLLDLLGELAAAGLIRVACAPEAAGQGLAVCGPAPALASD